MVRQVIHDPILLGIPSTPAGKEDLQVAHDLLDTLAHHKDGCVGRLRGLEPNQPHSNPFWCFFAYLPCLASARLRHLRKKSTKNYLLRGAWQFSAVCIFQDEENREDNTLCIIKGFSDVLGNADG